MPQYRPVWLEIAEQQYRNLPDDVRELRQQGLGATEIAKRLNIGRASVYRVLAA